LGIKNRKIVNRSSEKIVRTLVGADDATWERAKGWALRFVGAIPYYRDTNHALVNIAVRTINEVLSEQ